MPHDKPLRCVCFSISNELLIKLWLWFMITVIQSCILDHKNRQLLREKDEPKWTTRNKSVLRFPKWDSGWTLYTASVHRRNCVFHVRNAFSCWFILCYLFRLWFHCKWPKGLKYSMQLMCLLMNLFQHVVPHKKWLSLHGDLMNWEVCTISFYLSFFSP